MILKFKFQAHRILQNKHVRNQHKRWGYNEKTNKYGGAGLYKNAAILSVLNLISHPVCDSAETETKYKYNTEEKE